ncbi:MAG: hypothetical protein IPI58_05355 [Alphaproteobacteria bacterium]|nr:MAG: hypothetical protein IPI58_05355 [Alphaproteobacteria bacterium]
MTILMKDKRVRGQALGLIIGVCLSMASAPSWAEEAEIACPANNHANITIDLVFEEPEQKFSLSLREIQSLDNEANGKINPHLSRMGGKQISSKEMATHTLGLTSGNLVLDQSTSFSVRQIGPGRACVYLSDLKVTFGFRQHVVYVARELPRRSCPFNEVLKHEAKHVDTDRRLLNEKATWIKNEIMNAADKVSRVQVGHPDALQQDMQGSLHATIERIHDIVQAERRERQAEVDNPAEYARIGRTCNGQTQEIVDHFFQKPDIGAGRSR